MAYCHFCGKHTAFGNNVTQIRRGLFSRSKRKVRPNLQKATMMVDGRMQQITACTRCMRTANRIRQ